MMNQKNKIQTIVATSGFILPVAALIATLLWVAENVYDWSRLLGWLFCGINTYLWIETNNTHALMRVRSLMTPSLFVLLVKRIKITEFIRNARTRTHQRKIALYHIPKLW